MSPPAAPRIASLYRRLLRELPTNSTAALSRTSHAKLSAPSTIQQRIRSIIKSPPWVANQQSQVQQAEQFAQYVEAQRMYVTLIERYNPGMGMSEEERVRLSARRVGMNLPVEFETREGGKEGL